MPQETTTFQIPEGSNLTQIANQFDTTVDELVSLNTGNVGALPDPNNPNLILEGGFLNVPGEEPTIVGPEEAEQQVQTDLTELDQAEQQSTTPPPSISQPEQTTPEAEVEVISEGQMEQDSLEAQIQEQNQAAQGLINQEIEILQNFRQTMEAANQAIVDGITRVYGQRIAQMEDLNRRTLGIQTRLGFTSGRARFAPVHQTSILSAEEAAGIQRVANLEAERQSMIAQARRAAQEQDFKSLSTIMERRRELNELQTATLQDQLKIVVERNAEIQAQRDQVERDFSIISLVDEGVTDPVDVFLQLQGTVSLEDISATLEGILPDRNEVVDIAQQVAEFGAPQDVIDLILGSRTREEAVRNAGTALVDPTMQLDLMSKTLGIQKTQLQIREIAQNIQMAQNNTGFIFNRLSSGQQGAIFKLADDYESISGDFFDVRAAHQRVLNSAENPTAAGDLALIFNYMKVLDPRSVVKEGEFATAQNAGSVPDRIRAQYNIVRSGQRLSQDQRADFVNRSQALFEGALELQEQVNDLFISRATQFGIPADFVVRETDLGGPDLITDTIQEQPQEEEEETETGGLTPASQDIFSVFNELGVGI